MSGIELAAETAADAAEIALVDDDLSVRRGLSRLLRSAGFRVRVFSSAQEVLEGGLGPRARCLLADIHLGAGLSGLGLCERLRAEGSSIPFIFITAHDDPASREHAQRLGATAFLRKPFEASTLIDALRAALAEHR